jgi:hypothetical protein
VHSSVQQQVVEPERTRTSARQPAANWRNRPRPSPVRRSPTIELSSGLLSPLPSLAEGNYELRITNYKLRITNYELRITNERGMAKGRTVTSRKNRFEIPHSVFLRNS